jgi:hypothetical protein
MTIEIEYGEINFFFRKSWLKSTGRSGRVDRTAFIYGDNGPFCVCATLTCADREVSPGRCY